MSGGPPERQASAFLQRYIRQGAAPITGVTSETIAVQMEHGRFIPNFLEASDWVIDNAKPGDVIITLGAGDVNSLAPIISDGLARRFN